MSNVEVVELMPSDEKIKVVSSVTYEAAKGYFLQRFYALEENSTILTFIEEYIYSEITPDAINYVVNRTEALQNMWDNGYNFNGTSR